MLSFENFVKSMPPSLSELKVIPSFCFAFKISDDVTASNKGCLKVQLNLKKPGAPQNQKKIKPNLTEMKYFSKVKIFWLGLD